jgi:hypothetical protein
MFAQKPEFKRGIAGESVAAAWLQEKGYHLQPAYETLGLDFKGPRIFGPDRPFVAPDLWCVIRRAGQTAGLYAEVKTKTHFTWYGKGARFETGIDERHYLDYLALQEAVGLPVHMVFLHTTNQAWGEDVRRWAAPEIVGGGLFWGRLDALQPYTRSALMQQRGAEKPMVYWPRDALRRSLTLEQVVELARRNGLPWPPR